MDAEGILEAINYKMYSMINGKPKLIVLKLDNLEKPMEEKACAC
jgi:hypothetical protein